MAALRGDTTALLKQLKIEMPTYADPGGVSRAAFDGVAGFDGYPMTFVLDRKGTIQGVWSGFQPGIEKEMESLVGKLLEEG